MIDHDKLREAIRQMKMWMPKHPAAVWANAVLAAAESTLPKTKMVEVWRVEWCAGQQPHSQTFLWRDTADHVAENLRGHRECSCIRVTGPHMQEIPCD